jgi:hypothetical protein
VVTRRRKSPRFSYQQSVSFTAGVRGANLTYNTKGYRTASVGLPGTGLWYRDTRKVGPRRGPGRSRNVPPSPGWPGTGRVPRGLPPWWPPNLTPEVIAPLAAEANVTPKVFTAWMVAKPEATMALSHGLAWIDAHQQEGQAIAQWFDQMAEWAEGLDSARWEQAWDLIRARVHKWVQLAVDAGQHNFVLEIYAQNLLSNGIEAGLEAVHRTFAKQYPAMDWMNQHQERCASFGRKFANPPDPANRELELEFVARMVREARALVNEAIVKARENPDSPVLQDYARAAEAITLDTRDGRQVRVLDIEGPD